MLCPDLGYGGAELSFANVSRLLSQRHDVFCAVFNADIEQFYELGGPLYILDPVSQRRSRLGILRLLRRVMALRRLKRKLAVQISISFLEGADYVNYLSGRPGQRFASIRGSKLRDQRIIGLSGWWRRNVFMRWVYPRMNGIVPVSTAVAREMSSFFAVPPNKICTIQNFYDLKKHDAAASEPLPATFASVWAEHAVLTCVGRLDENKNQEGLLHVFARARRRRPKLRLALIGDGPAQKRLLTVCKNLGLQCWLVGTGTPVDPSAVVWFLGYQVNPHMFVARSMAFLFPSRHEGFPNALVEAMLCGVPVIASDCSGGCREILEIPEDVSCHGPIQGTGAVLVPVPDPDVRTLGAWEEAINLVDEDLVGLGVAARAQAKKFTGDEASQRWFTLIDTALVDTYKPPLGG